MEYNSMTANIKHILYSTWLFYGLYSQIQYDISIGT